MSDDDVFYHINMIMNVDQAEIAKIVHDYIERDIGCDYDRLNSPPPPIPIRPVKIKTLKERLEEATMHEDCYFCIKRNICTKDVPKPCKYRYTEEERIADQAADRVGVILNATYLPDTYYKKEDNKMKKATSVQNIKNVKGVSFLIENHPMEEESKLTIVASTDDDIFEFEFEGPDLLQSCKAAGLFTGWEKDQKIKELEQENETKCENCLAGASYEEMYNNLRDRMKKEYEEKIKELEKELGDCLKITDEIRRQKNREINKLKQQLTQENEKLKELKTPTIENFVDKEPTSRRDILKAAEMCVCGQREQDYGTPESNFQLIADLWNDYLKKEKSSIVVDSMDVAMMMALLKIARIRNGGGSGDSFVDLAGYAACGGEIWYGGKTSIPKGE